MMWIGIIQANDNSQGRKQALWTKNKSSNAIFRLTQNASQRRYVRSERLHLSYCWVRWMNDHRHLNHPTMGGLNSAGGLVDS